MSSPQSPDKQDESTEAAPTEDASEESVSEAVVETAQCPNCGHEFNGTYCPECGQEADPSVSATGVVGGFLRELVDVEHGFWPTLVGLTLRPGKTLQQYLRGVRKGLASPGRYFLAVVVIAIGVDQFLLLTGVASPDSGSSPEEEEGAAKAIDVAFDRMDFIFEGQARIIFFLLMIGPLAALLYRLFEERFDQMVEALAVGSFQAAHANLLANGVWMVLTVFVFLYTGHSVESSGLAGLAGVMVYLGYIGFANNRCFGPGWWSILKGFFAGIWSMVEAFLVWIAGGTAYATWLVWARPDKYVPTGPEIEASAGELILVFPLVGLLCLLPLLLHAGVEAYYRLW